MSSLDSMGPQDSMKCHRGLAGTVAWSVSDWTFDINSDLEIFASFLASENIKLVYGGGKCGLMGKLSEEVSKNKGKIKGISLPMFDDIGVTPEYLDELEIQENFYTRKKSLIDQSDFFVIMPGGVGTADEFFDVLF